MCPFQESGFTPLQANAVQSTAQPLDISPSGTNSNSLLGGSGMTNNLQLGLGSIQVLGSLWNSFQQNKLAKESLKFQKNAYSTNLKNQTQSYNTALEDRINARYATEGRSEEADAYISKHRL